jgi:hypothetical protein
MRRCLAVLVMTLGGALAVPGHAAQCSAQSGPHTTALVELYTSEGCNSCPPADRWLSSLGARGYGPDRVVPIALHVDYWDYIGWKDPYAQARFSARQRELAQVHRARVVYTPQVMLQGADFRSWRGDAFDREVARINAMPAGARIRLQLDASEKGAVVTEIDAALAEPSMAGDAKLYFAVYENRLVSKVAAGENRGRTLAHDHVVLKWIGPLDFGPDGRLARSHRFGPLPTAIRENSGVAAFVQSRSTAKVLQALMLPVCRAG